MPVNCLIQPSSGGDPRAVCPLYDPAPEHAHRRRFRREKIPDLERANSFYVSNGLTPSRGWVLVRRGDYDEIDPYATDLQLSLADTEGNTPELLLGNLAVVQARCVSRGFELDPDAIYLVELCDGQGLLYNPWYAFPITSQYNLRPPAYATSSGSDPGGFYADSLQGGAALWAWDALVGDLWGQMGFALGPYPGLPVAPDEDPEGYSFTGVGGWEALNYVLDFVGCTVSTDLTDLETPYGIVVYGAADQKLTDLETQFDGLLEDDLEYIDAGSGRTPGKVVVFLHRRNRFFGTEEVVRRDGLQWTSTPLYSVTVTAGDVGFTQFDTSPGVGYLWADFAVRFDEDGNPLAEDETTAQAVALSRAAEWYTRVARSSLGYMRRDYAGLVPFATGGVIDGVKWHMTRRNGRLGWRTSIVRGPTPPWPEVAWENR